MPSDNSGARFKLSIGNENDAEVIENGIDTYSEAYEPEYESVGFSKKLTDKDGRLLAGVIADMDRGGNGFVGAVFVEEPFRRRGLGTFLLREAEKLAISS